MQLCDWTCFQKSPSDWALISLFSISLGKYRFHIAEDKESLVRKDAEAMWDTCLPLSQNLCCVTQESPPLLLYLPAQPRYVFWNGKTNPVFLTGFFFFFILAHSFKHPAELEQTEPTASQVQTWPEAAFSPPPPLLAQHPTPFLGHVIVRRPGYIIPKCFICPHLQGGAVYKGSQTANWAMSDLLGQLPEMLHADACGKAASHEICLRCFTDLHCNLSKAL